MSSNEVDYPHAEADSAQATIATPVGPITITGNGQSIIRVDDERRKSGRGLISPPAPPGLGCLRIRFSPKR